VESDIGGRPIATFKLTTPIEVRSRDGGTRFVDVVEIPSPKDGSPYGAGLEHVEFVVGDCGGTETAPPRNSRGSVYRQFSPPLKRQLKRFTAPIISSLVATSPVLLQAR
ncbi:VOC family protein, partial [bacterium]|nr:VOC family protein [bacterium]